MKKVVIINGPNLNLTGQREPEIYGTLSLAEINAELSDYATTLGFEVVFYQSNSESEIIDLLHSCRSDNAGVIINPGAYSHTSVAILDALLALEVPAVEVHLSNIFKREQFRQQSYTARGVQGVVSGFGKHSYLMALKYLADITS